MYAAAIWRRIESFVTCREWPVQNTAHRKGIFHILDATPHPATKPTIMNTFKNSIICSALLLFIFSRCLISSCMLHVYLSKGNSRKSFTTVYFFGNRTIVMKFRSAEDNALRVCAWAFRTLVVSICKPILTLPICKEVNGTAGLSKETRIALHNYMRLLNGNWTSTWGESYTMNTQYTRPPLLVAYFLK